MNPPLSQPREAYNYSLDIEKNQKNQSEIEREYENVLYCFCPGVDAIHIKE